MPIRDCIDRLVAAGRVSRETARDAMALYDRMSARYSAEAPPASAEAAAALATARALRAGAAEQAARIAHDVRTWADLENRVTAHPNGRSAGLMSAMTKDMFRGSDAMHALEPDSIVKTAPNVDYLHANARARFFNIFSAGMEAYRHGFLGNAEKIQGVKNMVHEIFGADTGDAVAKTAAAGWKAAHEQAEREARVTGKVFDANENWNMPQHWEARRVKLVSEDDYVKAWKEELDRGGVELWDKDFNKPVQTAEREQFILRRAYNDIIAEGGRAVPFSQEMRTFRFKQGAEGAESFLRMQDKFGVGNDILGMLTGHLDHMAREIAMARIFGSNPQATFAAAMRLVKQDSALKEVGRFNPARLMSGLFENNKQLENTFKVITGRANVTHSEIVSNLIGGARDLIGAASLRNLPISIIPSDTVTTFLAANHLGMDGFKILRELTDGATSREAAQHLQVNVHGAIDYVNNSVRKYEDEINASGIARKVSRGIVTATGADLWTTAGRRAAQTSMVNQIAEMQKFGWADLPANFRRNFLEAYGFTPADWDKLRAVPPLEINGTRYYVNPDAVEPRLYERLLNAVQEQSAYMFHQPDARTRGFATGGTERGTAAGELFRSVFQYKQFALERMTTHLMRTFIDGDPSSRIMRGAAFTIFSMAAGAVSLQAAAIVAGKDPIDMKLPKFWVEAFVKGGAGGIYGDILSAAIRGDRGAGDITAAIAGPLPGLGADLLRTAAAPIREELDTSGRIREDTKGREAIGVAKRFTPNTWYTRLAVDRLIWDKLQTLVDPEYRRSFSRAEDRARKDGSPFWWSPGEGTPARPPNFANAIGR